MSSEREEVRRLQRDADGMPSTPHVGSRVAVHVEHGNTRWGTVAETRGNWMLLEDGGWSAWKHRYDIWRVSDAT